MGRLLNLETCSRNIAGTDLTLDLVGCRDTSFHREGVVDSLTDRALIHQPITVPSLGPRRCAEVAGVMKRTVILLQPAGPCKPVEAALSNFKKNLEPNDLCRRTTSQLAIERREFSEKARWDKSGWLVLKIPARIAL